MANYWKREIISDYNFVWREDPRELCGVMMDPVHFIPLYLKRFLGRRELEGKLPVPGTYAIELKVIQ